MHVLYAAWGFPPHRGPGTYRAVATVDHLVRSGHQVTVVTADTPYFDLVTGSDYSLLDRVDPRVDIVRVPFPAGIREPILNRWPQSRADAVRTWHTAALAEESRVFPEAGYSFWRPRVEQVAYAVQRHQHVDLVIATGNPYVDFSVPMLLNAEFGTPFVLDDRDSWILNVYTGDPYPGAEVQIDWLGRLLESCIETWFVNPPIARWHRERFPEHSDRIHVVENGWDPIFIDPATLNPVNDGNLVFGFLGTITAGLPLEPMFEGWRMARLAGLPAESQLRLYGHLGHVRASRAQELLVQAAEKDGVVHMGRWPKTEISTAYRQIDVLVFAKEGGGMVTSGKIYEYVATGKPIAGVIAAQHDARRVLVDYPRCHLAEGGSAADWCRVFLSAAKDALARDRSVLEGALACGDTFQRGRILGPALDRVLARVGTDVKSDG